MTEPNTKLKNIYYRMLDVMEDVSYIQKENKKVNDQYTFVSHDAVAKEVRTALLKHRVAFEQKIISHSLELKEVCESVMIWDNTKKAKVPLMGEDGKPVEKMVTGYVATIFIEFIFINPDAPQERMSAHGFGMGLDTQDKATGKAMSYAKKYALLNALLLATGDDPEQDTNVSVAANRPDSKRPNASDNVKKYKEYLDCLAKVDNKELWLKVKPKKDAWVTWATQNYSSEYGDQLNDKFLELAKKFEAPANSIDDDLPEFLKQ